MWKAHGFPRESDLQMVGFHIYVLEWQRRVEAKALESLVSTAFQIPAILSVPIGI